jgi:hypothetical protein
MSKASYKVPRISTEDDVELKRGLERTLSEVSTAIDTLQDGIPNFYVTERPTQVASLQQIICHEDYPWINFESDEVTPVAVPLLTNEGGIFMWFVKPYPESVIDNPPVDPDTLIPLDVGGYWVKLKDIGEVTAP